MGRTNTAHTVMSRQLDELDALEAATERARLEVVEAARAMLAVPRLEVTSALVPAGFAGALLHLGGAVETLDAAQGAEDAQRRACGLFVPPRSPWWQK